MSDKKRPIAAGERGAFLLLLIMLTLSSCADKQPAHYAAPALIPGTERRMKSPGFWIERHPFPDKVIIKSRHIKELNAHIVNVLETRKVITDCDHRYAGDELLSRLKNKLDRFHKKRPYLATGNRAGPDFFSEIRERMDLHGIRYETRLKYGLTTFLSDQRIFPTKQGLFTGPNDTDIDKLQNNALDIGTPLAILHMSSDKKWYYVTGPLSSGWVETKNIALCRRDELKRMTIPSSFIVVIRPKAGIYLNHSLTKYHDYVRMGVKLPFCGMDSETVRVLIPVRNPRGILEEKIGYMRKECVHKGHLPFTARNIIQQAFELLNEPYGWGGLYGEQDCSRFIQEVFSTVGIFLPRNSFDQAHVGRLIGVFDKNATEKEKLEVLSRKAFGGISLLYLKGHIMLYLGTADQRPYVMHATWAYRGPSARGNKIQKINRVAFTDLYLGKGSKNGSLLKRLRSIRNIVSPN